MVLRMIFYIVPDQNLADVGDPLLHPAVFNGSATAARLGT